MWSVGFLFKEIKVNFLGKKPDNFPVNFFFFLIELQTRAVFYNKFSLHLYLQGVLTICAYLYAWQQRSFLYIPLIKYKMPTGSHLWGTAERACGYYGMWVSVTVGKIKEILHD